MTKGRDILFFKEKKEQIYKQLYDILRERKLSQTQLAEKLQIYPGRQNFSQALVNRTIKLEGWHEIADVLGMRLLMKLVDAPSESGGQAQEPEQVYFDEMAELRRCKQRERDLEEMINGLRSQLSDKQEIIDLLRKKDGKKTK